MPTVEELIRMREEAIRSLLEEKEKLQQQLEAIRSQIEGMEANLQRLGYVGALPSKVIKSTKRGVSKPSDEFTLEMFLDGKAPATVSLFHQLSENITSLGSGINISAHKKSAAFSTQHNFCEVVLFVSKLTIYLDIPLSDLHDPKRIAEDCSTIGRWATGKTRFQLFSAEGMEYAMDLIRQSFQYNTSS